MITNHIIRYEGAISKEKCSEIIKHIKFFENNGMLISKQHHNVHHDSYNLNQDYDVNLVANHRLAGEILSNLQGCVYNYLKLLHYGKIIVSYLQMLS